MHEKNTVSPRLVSPARSSAQPPSAQRSAISLRWRRILDVSWGALYDHCGLAEVRGTLEGDKLAFEKRYAHRNDPIYYELTQGSVPMEFSGMYKGLLAGVGSTKLIVAEPPKGFFTL